MKEGQAEAKERWMELCEQAAIEQDAGRLMELVREINKELERKRRRAAPDPTDV